MDESDIDKAERIAREALRGLHADLPDWFWPEGTLGLVEQTRDSEAEAKRLRDGIAAHRSRILSRHDTLGWVGVREDAELWSLLGED